MDEWDNYLDMLESDMLPDFGFRIITFMNSDGQRGYKWHGSGDFSIEDIVMMLERVKFLMQFRTELPEAIPAIAISFGFEPPPQLSTGE